MTLKVNTDPKPSKSSMTNRDKVIELIKYHKPLFIKEGVTNPKFIPRLCYPHKGVQVVTFFQKEIAGGQDIYIEFCNRELEPEDENRTLWKWIFNPEYDTEYELSDPHPSSSDRRYIIPITELVNVKEFHEKQTAGESPLAAGPVLPEPDSPTGSWIKLEETDVPYEAMTIRDYAAIQWKMPVSNKPWLNELIIKTFK